MAKILVAEDDTPTRELVRVALEHKGHTVYEAASGPETLEKAFRHGPVDLILLDVMLPGMDGHTLLMRLGDYPNMDLIPVVIMSAVHATADLFDKFPQVVGFLKKPFETQQLFGLVDKSIGVLIFRKKG